VTGPYIPMPDHVREAFERATGKKFPKKVAPAAPVTPPDPMLEPLPRDDLAPGSKGLLSGGDSL